MCCSFMISEMLARGYKPQLTECLCEQWNKLIPSGCWRDYVPTSEAMRVNRERIALRIVGEE